jgi:hypothetical protein
MCALRFGPEVRRARASRRRPKQVHPIDPAPGPDDFGRPPEF